jgi:hypothetical protein
LPFPFLLGSSLLPVVAQVAGAPSPEQAHQHQRRQLGYTGKAR